MPKHCLVFHTSTNRKGRKDATGAFNPEAKAFVKLHGVYRHCVIRIPHHLTRGERRRKFERACVLQKGNELDAIVYFGHGVKNGLPGLGYRVGDGSYKRMVNAIAQCIHPQGKLVLYACLAGKGFGIADKIDIALAELGFPDVQTVSHISKGHTAWNPLGEYSGEGPQKHGVPIIDRFNPLWKTWLERLRKEQAFRLSFPFMSQAEIESELWGEHVPAGPSKLVEQRR